MADRCDALLPHGEKVECANVDGKRAVLGFSGVLPNGLGYRARADVVSDDACAYVKMDGECLTVGGSKFTVYLRAVTTYDMKRDDCGLSGKVPEG